MLTSEQGKLKILITGANGFVGRHLCAALPLHELVLVTRNIHLSSNTYVVGDISQFQNWDRVFNDVDVVIHLAARVHQKICHNEAAYVRDNVQAVKRIADAAVEAGVKRFIFLSTIKVNGEATYGRPFTASDLPGPVEPYGASKAAAEQALLEISRRSSLEVVIIRPPLVYGPNVKANFQTLWSLAGSRWPLPFGLINNRRDMVSVYNLCDFIRHCIDAPQAKNRIFLVSDGRPYSLAELIAVMRHVRGRSNGLIKVPVVLLSGALKLLGRSALVSRLFGDLEVDITETKRLLSWQPVRGLEYSCIKMLEHEQKSLNE